MRQTSRNGKNKQIKQQKKNKIQIIDTLYIFTANYVVFLLFFSLSEYFYSFKEEYKSQRNTFIPDQNCVRH